VAVIAKTGMGYFFITKGLSLFRKQNYHFELQIPNPNSRFQVSSPDIQQSELPTIQQSDYPTA
jgi:hypothetical protein